MQSVTTYEEDGKDACADDSCGQHETANFEMRGVTRLAGCVFSIKGQTAFGAGFLRRSLSAKNDMAANATDDKTRSNDWLPVR